MNSKVSLGQQAERDALRFLFIREENKMPYKHPFDYKAWGLRIDIKSARIKEDNSAHQYCFRVKREKHVSDFYLCMCYKNEELQNAYLLPSCVCKTNDIRIPIQEDDAIGNAYEDYRLL